MSSFNLKIVSFNKSLYSKSIDMVVLPGAFGDISITSMGRSFAYVLTSGVIYVFEGNEKKRFFIQGGRFLSSSNEVVVSIEGDFFDLDTLKEQEIHKKIETYQALLKNEDNKTKRNFYDSKIHLYNKIINFASVVLYK